MYVGIGFIKIRIYDAYSLKDRRQVLNSVVTKLQNKFNLSVSIVDSGDVWNLAEIGTAVVSSSKQLIESMYQKIDDILEDDHRFEVIVFEVDIQKEI